MNFRLIFVFILLFNTNLFSATPTVEDLFKNVGNQSVTSNHIVLKFLVEESDDKLFEDKKNKAESDIGFLAKDTESSESSQTVNKKSKLPLRFITWTFSLKGEGHTELFQEVYSDSSMKGQHLEFINYLKDYNSKIREEKNIEKSLFYALMSTLVLNDSKGMANLLKKQDTAFLTNYMLLDKEKIKLLEKHKRYLADKKRNGKKSNSSESEEDLKKNQVDEIISDSIYQKNDQVMLTRVEGNFYWSVDLPKFKALFRNDSRELYRVDLNGSDASTITAIMGNYLLFDGIHQLPKRILFKTSGDQNYVIKILELKHNTQAVDLAKLSDQFQKTLEIKERNSSKAGKSENFGSYFFVK